jgi:hypothetical protein
VAGLCVAGRARDCVVFLLPLGCVAVSCGAHRTFLSSPGAHRARARAHRARGSAGARVLSTYLTVCTTYHGTYLTAVFPAQTETDLSKL